MNVTRFASRNRKGMRSFLPFFIVLGALSASAQVIDSIRIFKSIRAGEYSTSLAETTAWRLHLAGAAYVSIGPAELKGLNEELRKHRPEKHAHSALPGLTHIGFAYTNRTAHVFCLADGHGLIIDLTARWQFRIEDWDDRLELRALLVALGL